MAINQTNANPTLMAAAATVVQVLPELLSKERIKKDQDQIRTNLLGLDQTVHANAVQCMLHAEKHGDTSLMRRLLVETLGGKTGYRLQGIINWMRKHSPMELKGDIVNLSGTIENAGQVEAMKKMFPDVDRALFQVGLKRPFLIKEAAATPFWNDAGNAERVAKPVFTDTLLSPIDKMVKDFKAALENTANGNAVDPSKPYFMGIHVDKVQAFIDTVEKAKAELPNDDTREVFIRRQRIAEDTDFVSQHDKKVA